MRYLLIAHKNQTVVRGWLGINCISRHSYHKVEEAKKCSLTFPILEENFSLLKINNIDHYVTFVCSALWFFGQMIFSGFSVDQFFCHQENLFNTATNDS